MERQIGRQTDRQTDRSVTIAGVAEHQAVVGVAVLFEQSGERVQSGGFEPLGPLADDVQGHCPPCLSPFPLAPLGATAALLRPALPRARLAAGLAQLGVQILQDGKNKLFEK